jgi:hypothetical protein
MLTRRALFGFASSLLAIHKAGAANSTLKHVSKVFIEKMGNEFDNDLRVQISRQFKGRVNVVLDREVADAVLIGVNKDDQAGGAKGTLRYLGIDSVSSGTLTLLDKTGKIILWTDEAGDRAPWLSNGGMVPTARKTIAERLIRKMKRAFDTAI